MHVKKTSIIKTDHSVEKESFKKEKESLEKNHGKGEFCTVSLQEVLVQRQMENVCGCGCGRITRR